MKKPKLGTRLTRARRFVVGTNISPIIELTDVVGIDYTLREARRVRKTWSDGVVYELVPVEPG